MSTPHRRVLEEADGWCIDACICLDNIDAFVSSNAVAIAGVALAGKAYVVSAITTMVSLAYQNSTRWILTL